ncbi:MAG: pirin family protein [Proteobacteria bacterium]|nr:pirin family protein [Pseudomonadota bacterium]
MPKHMKRAINLRAVTKVVPAKDIGPFYRVIGSLDEIGQGSLHAVRDINPFTLFDEVKVTKKAGVPPFGAHPHHGLQVLTCIMKGSYSNKLWDDPEAVYEAPMGVCLNAGRGVVHEEKTAVPDETKALQIVWLIPEESRSKVATEFAQKPHLVEFESGASVRVWVGHPFGDKSASTVVTPTPVNIITGTLKPNGSLDIGDTCAGGAFFYPFSAEANVQVSDSETVKSRHVAIFDEASGGTIKFKNESGTDEVEFVCGWGARIEEPWVKLLTHNGFFLARSLEAAQLQEKLFLEQGITSYGK